jgi:hypothetical protein
MKNHTKIDWGAMVGKALAALTNSKLGVGTQACLEPWVGNPKPNPNPTLTGMVPLPMSWVQ